MIERFFVEQGIKKVELEDFLRKELERAGFTKAEIVKTPLVTRIVINVVKPGLAIGRSGSAIKTLTETIEKRFGLENTQIEIREIKQPDLDATAVVNKMKSLIERGFSWRSVVYRTLKDIIDAKAEGVEIVVGGKLSGKGGRKRSQRVIHGYMKKVGDQAKLVDSAKGAANTKAGTIGLRIRIVRPGTIFPDKINLKEYLAGREAASAKPVVETKKEIAVEDEKTPVKENAEKEAHAVEKKEEAKETSASSQHEGKDKKAKAAPKKGEKETSAKDGKKPEEKKEKPSKKDGGEHHAKAHHKAKESGEKKKKTSEKKGDK